VVSSSEGRKFSIYTPPIYNCKPIKEANGIGHFLPINCLGYGNSTIQAELASLTNRHMELQGHKGNRIFGKFKTTAHYRVDFENECVSFGINNMRRYLPDRNAFAGPLHELSREEYIAGMGKSYQNIERKEFVRPSTNLFSFIKKEKVDMTKYKAPRMIQASSKQLNIELGRFTKPLEHMVYKIDKVQGWNNFAKQVDMEQSAKQILSKMRKFKRPKFYCLDMKAFDASVTNNIKRIENTFIEQCYKDKINKMKYALHQQKN